MYIRDIGSSSGTLLNSVRISEAGIQSSNFELQSGDIIQLGKDYIDPKNKGQKTSIVEG